MDDSSRTKVELSDELVHAHRKIAVLERRSAQLAPGQDMPAENGQARYMQALLEALPDTIYRIKTDGTFLELKTTRMDLLAPPGSTTGSRTPRGGLPENVRRDLHRLTCEAAEKDGVVEYGYEVTAGSRIQAFLARIVKVAEDEALCIIRDVSEKKEAEQALSEWENKFKCLVEQSLVGVFLVRDGFFTYVNCELADIFGYAIDEIVDRKRPVDLGFPEDCCPAVEQAGIRLPFDAGSMQYEFRGKRKDGQVVYVEMHATWTMDRTRPAVLGVLLDKTGQKKLGAQLVQSERIKAIGTLAGGIAHDFNNLLMGIQGHASLLLHRLDPTDPAYIKLKGIEDLVKSASDLTRKLLGFASGAKYEIKTLDVNAILRKTSEIFGRTRKEIVIKSCYEENRCAVEADSGQIEQMLFNLYLNASQAMPGGGTLSLTTENMLLDKRFVRPYSLKEGRYVKISVEDTGEGMDDKTKERIFEPFFTTKRAGRGTGLGLASVYQIVKAHGGLITVYSEKGRGTIFCIFLPASKKTVEMVSDAPAEPRPMEKGAETILLVDDEEAVTSVSKDMLEVLGYSVLIARSGQEAINIYEKQHNAIDLIVLDVVMPDMGGEETLARLRGIKPTAVVALSSGYGLDRQVTKIMQQGCKTFIQKPFTINVLSQKLREALDS